MSTQVILMQKVEKLGELGDVVTVKPGFARNYLLPQGKALRATKQNVAYFESQKKQIETDNKDKKAAAEKLAKKIQGIKVPLIRQASESGQLYGSVNSRNIAEAIAETSGETITKSDVDINRNFKTIGLFPVDVVLHPEVKVEVTINIARNEEEAKIQADTGRALIATADDDIEETPAAQNNADLETVLEDEALEIKKEKDEAAAKDAERKAAKAEAVKEKAEDKADAAEDTDAVAEEEETA